MSLDELKRMMEVLGAPQTHIGLKQMIKEVCFRIFILVVIGIIKEGFYPKNLVLCC